MFSHLRMVQQVRVWASVAMASSLDRRRQGEAGVDGSTNPQQQDEAPASLAH